MFQSAGATFLAKFFVAVSFAIFFFIFSMPVAVALSVFWGLFLTAVFGLYLAKMEHRDVWKLVSSHVVLTIIVILISHYVGQLIAAVFSA
jgi:VIT1/CCC1 family predicted Fe2+/Mn2+ transporter